MHAHNYQKSKDLYEIEKVKPVINHQLFFYFQYMYFSYSSQSTICSQLEKCL